MTVYTDVSASTTPAQLGFGFSYNYVQDWPAYNQAQRHEKAEFMRLLSDLCQLAAAPDVPAKRGRPKVPRQDMLFAMAFKVYSTLSGRRFMGDLVNGTLSRPALCQKAPATSRLSCHGRWRRATGPRRSRSHRRWNRRRRARRIGRPPSLRQCRQQSPPGRSQEPRMHRPPSRRRAERRQSCDVRHRCSRF